MKYFYSSSFFGRIMETPAGYGKNLKGKGLRRYWLSREKNVMNNSAKTLNYFGFNTRTMAYKNISQLKSDKSATNGAKGFVAQA